MATFGFIGTGNMGGALARAARKRLSGGEILLANRSATKAEALAQELDCRAVDNAAVAAGADYIFLGVKPYMVAGLMEKIGPVLAARKDRFVLVSMAAAHTIPDQRERGCGDWPLIRIMPNTPALLGEGMTGVTYDRGLFTEEEEQEIRAFFQSFGRMEYVEERLMSAVVCASGSSPAYVYMFIEALADGCVKNGLPRQAAYKMVAQAVLGSAKMVLETGKHPGELKDMVCSPGGTTIEGLAALEENGFRGAIIKACDANFEKNKKLKG